MSRAPDAKFDPSDDIPAIKMEEIESGDDRHSRPFAGYATSQTPFEQNFYGSEPVIRAARRLNELHGIKEKLPSSFNYFRSPPARSSSPSPSTGPESNRFNSTGAGVCMPNSRETNKTVVQPSLPLSQFPVPPPRTGDISNDFASQKAIPRASGLSSPKFAWTGQDELGAQNPPPLSSHSSPPSFVEDAQHDQGHEDVELDRLRSLLREYGDSKAVISQLHSVETLITAAGGYRSLQQLVRDRDAIQQKLNNGIALDNIDVFISEVQSLRVMNQKYTELRGQVEGPKGLRTKALKYETLKHSLDEVKQTIDNAYNKTKKSNPVPSVRPPVNAVHNTNIGAVNRYAPPPSNSIGIKSVPGMNPARAQLIQSMKSQEDPDRDLYEAKRPAPSTNAKTGSNNIPLGKTRAQRSVTPPIWTHGGAGLKRKDPQGLLGQIEKRLRPDDMPATTSTAGINPGSFSTSPLLERTGSSTMYEGIKSAFIGLPQTLPYARYEKQTPIANTSSTDTTHLSSTDDTVTSTSETEEARGVRFFCNLDMMSFVPKGFAPKYSGGMMPYSVGLWSNMQYKVPAWGQKEMELLTTNIPQELGVYLVEKLLSNITSTNVHLWNTMLEGGDQCIVSYILHGPKPSRGGRIYHACEECSLRVRPCALLKNVHGVPTLVILPLSATVRQSQNWSDKKFWLADRN